MKRTFVSLRRFAELTGKPVTQVYATCLGGRLEAKLDQRFEWHIAVEELERHLRREFEAQLKFIRALASELP